MLETNNCLDNPRIFRIKILPINESDRLCLHETLFSNLETLRSQLSWSTLGNLRNDDEGTTTTLHIRGRLDRGFGFRRENLKVKRTILREDDGILGHYRSL